MGFLTEPVIFPRRIEYLRHHYEPQKYHPQETEFIAQPGHEGKLWASLGITSVGLPEIRMLAAGIHPLSGKTLTARMHGRHSSDQRRTAYLSVVLNVPKSVSIMAEIGGDRRLRECVRQAASETLQHAEKGYAGFRVRKKQAPDRNYHRPTGAMAWMTRLENDSRYADPHLHVHAEVINATLDRSDPKRPFKALDMRPFLVSQVELRRFFDSKVADAVQRLGYHIHASASSPFEITGVPTTLIDRFSKGRAAAAALMAAQHDERASPTPSDIQKLARKRRPKKMLRTQRELRAIWLSQVRPQELALLRAARVTAEKLAASLSLSELDDLLDPIDLTGAARRIFTPDFTTHQALS